jgi:hypothetical protein
MLDIDMILTRAADTIEDDTQPFNYVRWNECMCGHITAAACESSPTEMTEVQCIDWNNGSEGRAVYREINSRAGLGTPIYGEPHLAVSDRSIGTTREDAAAWLRSLRVRVPEVVA